MKKEVTAANLDAAFLLFWPNCRCERKFHVKANDYASGWANDMGRRDRQIGAKTLQERVAIDWDV